MAYIHTLKTSSHAEKYILSLFINKQSTENALEPKTLRFNYLSHQKVLLI